MKIIDQLVNAFIRGIGYRASKAIPVKLAVVIVVIASILKALGGK